MSVISKLITLGAAGSGGAGPTAASVAFVGGGNKVHPVNVTNPNSISRLQEFDVNLFISGFDPDGLSFDVGTSVLYAVSEAADGIVSINASNPSSLSVLGNITYDSALDNANSMFLDAENKVLFYSGSRRLRSVNVSNPSGMSILQTLDLTASYSVLRILCFDKERSILFCSWQEANSPYARGLLTVDVSNPSAMSVSNTITIPGLTAEFGLDGALDSVNNVLYATHDSTSAVYAIDVSDVASMSVLSVFTDPDLSNLKEIFVDVFNGGICYVVSGNGSNKLVALNVSNPSSISKLSAFTSGSMIEPTSVSCDVVSQIAYVGCNAGGSATENTLAIDISNPSSMSVLSTLGGTNVKAITLNIAGLEANKSL